MLQWCLSCCSTSTCAINHDAGKGSLCCSVLRKIECDLIEKKDAAVKGEHADATLDRLTKRRLKGLTHKIPGRMIGSFEIRVSQLGIEREEKSRLVSNMNDESGTRIQNVGEHALSKMAKELSM